MKTKTIAAGVIVGGSLLAGVAIAQTTNLAINFTLTIPADKKTEIIDDLFDSYTREGATYDGSNVNNWVKNNVQKEFEQMVKNRIKTQRQFAAIEALKEQLANFDATAEQDLAGLVVE